MHVDWMLIDLEKVDEDDTTVSYRFSSDIRTQHPVYEHGSVAVGRADGTLMLDKSSGEVILVNSMPHDSKEMCASRAARKVREAWEKKLYPNQMQYACG